MGLFGNSELRINVDEIRQCKTELYKATEKMEDIQANLQKAMDDLTASGGWKSTGQSYFIKQYETTWVEGAKDRIDIMKRLCDNLENALLEYQEVVEEANRLNI